MENKPGIGGTTFKLKLDKDWLTPSKILSLIPYRDHYNLMISQIIDIINKEEMIIKKSDMTPQAQKQFEEIENKLKCASRDIDNEIETRNFDYYWAKGKAIVDERMQKRLEEHYPQQNTNNDLSNLQDCYLNELEKIRRKEKERTEINKKWDALFKREPTHSFPHPDKVLLIDPTQGKKESDGKLEYELDWDFIKLMAEVMSKNKGKYPPYNWKKPMDIEKLKQALLRHTLAIMNGEYDDDGRELGHFASVALNAMMTAYQLKNK